MAIAKALITGRVVIPGTDTGVRVSLTAAPLTDNQMLTWPAEDTVSWGSAQVETLEDGAIPPPGLAIPLASSLGSDVLWTIAARPLDRKDIRPWVMGAFEISADTSLANLVPVDISAHTPALAASFAAMVAGAAASSTSAAASADSAAASAAAATAIVIADADGAMAAAINTPGSDTEIALSATYASQTRVTQRGEDAISLGIPTDGVSDCAAALNAIPADTGKVHLNGTFKVSVPVTVPHHTQYVGVDRVRSRILAGAGFVGSTVVQLGPAASLAFDTRLSDMAVDAAGLVANAVTAGQIQEMCGLERVLATGFTGVGVDLTNGLAQNYSLTDIEVYGDAGSVNPNIIGIKTGAGRARVLSNITSIPPGAVNTAAPAGSIGVQLNGPANIIGLHVEGCVTGLDLNGATGSTVQGVSGIGGTGIVTDLVRVANVGQDSITLMGLSPMGSTRALNDLYHGGYTYAGYVGFYSWGGGGAGADTVLMSITQGPQRIYGPLNVAGNSSLGAVGFNGASPIAKPTVTGSRGGNAALASLLAELASYGLLTNGTTA